MTAVKNKKFFIEIAICFISVCYLITYFMVLKNIDARNYSAFYYRVTYIIIVPIFYFVSALMIAGLIRHYLFQKKYDTAAKKISGIAVLLILIYIAMLIYFFITGNYPLGFTFLIKNPWVFIIPGILGAIGSQ